MRRFMNRQRLLAVGFWLLAFGLTLSINSCSTTKETSTLRHLSANHIIREIEENSFDYDMLQAKLDIKFKDDKNTLGLKGQLRMQRDSLIWISLSLKVGIEIGRLMITPDSVKFLNRNKKTYIAESLSVFGDKLPIEPSIDFLQNIFVGNDTQIRRSDKSKVSTEDNNYKLEIVNTNVLKDIWVMPETFKILKYKIRAHDKDDKDMQLEYSNFKDYNERLLPSKIRFGLSYGNDIEVEIDYSNVTVDEEVEFPFNITKKFERIYLW